MRRTKNCIRCLKPAVAWTGYVIAKSSDVLAGWCASCRRLDEAGNLPGFMGRYTTKMGKRADLSEGDHR